MSTDACRLREHTLAVGMRAITIENALISVTLLPEKGADIYALVYKPREIDVLWKSPWGLRPPGRGILTTGASTEAAWLEHYEGGWQEIFPNGGDACVYKGAPLNFHGESSMLPWDYTVQADSGSRITIDFSVQLYRSPFVLKRSVTVEKGLPAVLLAEKLTNIAKEPMHFMWGHHPAYGAPFLSGDCRILLPAQSFVAHDTELSPAARIPAGASGAWPRITGKSGAEVDLSVVPGPDEPVFEFGYLCDLAEGWYAICSRLHGFGIGLAWPSRIFPYLWLWQELHGSYGYPWYGQCYVMALEPFTSFPGSGLVRAIEKGTAPELAPGASLDADLAAVFFEGSLGVNSISTDGTCRLAGK